VAVTLRRQKNRRTKTQGKIKMQGWSNSHGAGHSNSFGVSAKQLSVLV
jgi:hypothetical protein